jgi:hypothetical protein
LRIFFSRVVPKTIDARRIFEIIAVELWSGVVYALIDNTWDGRYALPFYATFSQENDQIACIRLSAEYLTATFEKSTAEVAEECAHHLPRPALVPSWLRVDLVPLKDQPRGHQAAWPGAHVSPLVTPNFK